VKSYKVLGLTDVHSHLLPYVDDGARNLQEALDLLQVCRDQGVRTIYLTPHWRKGMFETSDEDVQRQFARLLKVALSGVPELFLGREYYGSSLLPLLDNQTVSEKASVTENELPAASLLTLGESRYLLVECSGSSREEELLGIVKKICSADYVPLLAHAERYKAIQKEPELACRLHAAGAKIQVNAESVLGQEGIGQKRLCKQLLKQGSVFLLGSDAHRMDVRCPNLAQAAVYLRKKLSVPEWNTLFFENPSSLQQY